MIAVPATRDINTYLLNDDEVAYKIGRYTAENISLGYVQRIVLKSFWSIRRALEHVQKINDQLNRSKKIELVELKKNEAVATLAGGVAHDFNNILGIIVGNTELAMEDIPQWGPAHQNMAEIIKACLRARNVVRQILAFSRRTEYEMKPVKITPIIEDAIKLIRASIPSTIDIRLNLNCDTAVIRADPTQINQILINLCTNAAYAMKAKGGVLRVGLEEKTDPDPHVLAPGRYVRHYGS